MLIPHEKEKGGIDNPLLMAKDTTNKVASSEVRMRKPFKPFTFTM